VACVVADSVVSFIVFKIIRSYDNKSVLINTLKNRIFKIDPLLTKSIKHLKDEELNSHNLINLYLDMESEAYKDCHITPNEVFEAEIIDFMENQSKGKGDEVKGK
jgi:hypothetical protein